MEISKSKYDVLRNKFAELISIIGVLVFMSGPILFGWQVYKWLRVGEWIEMPMIKLFDNSYYSMNIVLYLNNIESWVGIQKILSWFLLKFSLSLFSIILGIIIVLIAQSLEVQTYIDPKILGQINSLETKDDK